jgi:hypothetical protein
MMFLHGSSASRRPLGQCRSSARHLAHAFHSRVARQAKPSTKAPGTKSGKPRAAPLRVVGSDACVELVGTEVMQNKCDSSKGQSWEAFWTYDRHVEPETKFPPLSTVQHSHGRVHGLPCANPTTRHATTSSMSEGSPAATTAKGGCSRWGSTKPTRARTPCTPNATTASRGTRCDWSCWTQVDAAGRRPRRVPPSYSRIAAPPHPSSSTRLRPWYWNWTAADGWIARSLGGRDRPNTFIQRPGGPKCLPSSWAEIAPLTPRPTHGNSTLSVNGWQSGGVIVACNGSPC